MCPNLPPRRRLRWKLVSKIGGLRTSRQEGNGSNRGAFRRMSAVRAQIEFISRYRIGALLPLRDHHQTMIVVARKR